MLKASVLSVLGSAASAGAASATAAESLASAFFVPLLSHDVIVAATARMAKLNNAFFIVLFF